MLNLLSPIKNNFSKFINQISSKVILTFFGVIILMVIGGGYWFFQYQTRIFYKANYQDLEFVAKYKIDQITQWRDERLSDAILFSTSPIIKETIFQWMKTPENLENYSKIQSSVQILQDLYEYNTVQITSSTGEIFFTTEHAIQEIEPSRFALIDQVTMKKSPMMGDFYRSILNETVYIDVAAPILDEDLNIVAILLLRIDPVNYIYPLIQSWPTDSQSGETLLIRKTGDQVEYLNSLRHSDAAPLTLLISTSQADLPAVRAVLGLSSPYEGFDYRGVKVLSQFFPIPDSNWYLVSKIDSKEVLDQIQQLGLNVTLIIIFSILSTSTMVALLISFRQRSLYQKLLEAERTAQLEHNLLSETLNASMNEIFLFDVETLTFRAVNEGALKNLGYSHDQMMYMTPLDIKPELDQKKFSEIISPLLENKQDLVIFETMHERKDYSRYPVEVHLQIVNVHKEPVFLAVIQDITERTQNEEKLRISFEKYQALFRTFPLGVMVTDQAGNIIEVNKEATRLLDLSEDEILKRTYNSPEWVTIHKDGSPMDWLEFPSSLAMRDKVLVENVEMGILRPNQEYVWVNSTAAPIPLKEYGILIIMADISDRIRIENALINSEERYRKLVENSPDAIFIYRDDRFEYINPAGLDLFGVQDPASMLGQPVINHFHPDFHEEVIQRNEFMRNHDEPVSLVQQKIIRLDGAVRDVEVAATTFTDSFGKSFQFIMRDITERKQAEEKLNEQLIELRRWNEVTLGRENRIIDLKNEINQLRNQTGLSAKYHMDTEGKLDG